VIDQVKTRVKEKTNK